MSDDKSKGKFDHYSHDQLYAMVANSKPERLIDVGDALEEAFHALDGISRDLKVYVTRVKLEGEGGQAFHKWGEKMVMQTTKLAYYVLAAGAGMKLAGEGLATTKSAMPKPDMMCYADPEKDKARLKNRDEAAGLMGALDNYYGVVGVELGKLEEPTFGLPPGIRDSHEDWARPYASTSSGGDVASGGGGGVRRTDFPNLAGPHGTGPGAAAHYDAGDVSGRPGIAAHVGPDTQHPGVDAGVYRPPGTNIDSVSTLPSPDVTTRPEIPLPASDSSRHPTVISGPSLPIGPSIAPPKGLSDSQGGIHPGRGPMGGGRTEAPAGTFRPGTTPFIGAKDGVVGGTPSRPGPGTGPGTGVPRIPRGTVIGDERGSMGRGPMAMGGFPGMPGGGATGPGNRAPGRRLATEPGGVTGVPRPQRAGPSEFTPGGTGLVRGGQGMAPLPHFGTAPTSEGRRNARNRPEYLVEDEETWTDGRRHTVPPVID
ncbi:hypothetical protein [Streptomyces albireticuli]|uniref:hypothetical protein n=1 Tax=Streptomyces albireticuli TaxID=1940 RepID=UPI00133133F0|nr:hypothetical protein [Streptomyces albireticuli]